MLGVWIKDLHFDKFPFSGHDRLWADLMPGVTQIKRSRPDLRHFVSVKQLVAPTKERRLDRPVVENFYNER